MLQVYRIGTYVSRKCKFQCLIELSNSLYIVSPCFPEVVTRLPVDTNTLGKRVCSNNAYIGTCRWKSYDNGMVYYLFIYCYHALSLPTTSDKIF